MRKTALTVPLLILLAASGPGGCSRNEGSPAATRVVPAAPATEQATGSGEVLFKQFCSSCHPDGGNVSDPERTLRRSALKKHHITTPDDIVRVMRSPISRMIRFDRETLSDRDARAIAEYILTTFN